jgi:hypothetical protein
MDHILQKDDKQIGNLQSIRPHSAHPANVPSKPARPPTARMMRDQSNLDDQTQFISFIPEYGGVPDVSKHVEYPSPKIQNPTGEEIKQFDYKDIMTQLDVMKCSINKLELNMKLVNEENIDDKEFEKLKVCCEGDNVRNYTGIKEICNDNLKFIEAAKLKQSFNKFSSYVKIVTFICPVLSIVNIGLLKQISQNTDLITVDKVNKAHAICDDVIAGISSGIKGISGILDNTENVAEILDFVGKSNDAGATETAVDVIKDIKKYIIKHVTAKIKAIPPKNIPKIFIAFMSLLYISIFCQVLLDEDSSQNILTDMTNLLTGGKKSRQKKQLHIKQTPKPKQTKPAKIPKVAQKKKK